MKEELKDAMNWLATIEVTSEYEASNKELILSYLDKFLEQN